MNLANNERSDWLRAFLVLGRVSHLPTVWSNCLAGWLLSGGGRPSRFLALYLGVTCFYVGGMILNNVWDAPATPPYRRDRLSSAGAIEAELAAFWCLVWFGLGTLLLVALGTPTAILTVLLLSGIALYHLMHRLVFFAPVLRAVCRFLLYLLAGSPAHAGLSGLTIWSGLALASYVLGLNLLARQDAPPKAARYWPAYPLAAPLLLAWVVNDTGYRWAAFWCSIVLAGWTLWCLRSVFWATHRSLGRAVLGLTAGIILVDLVAVAGGSIAPRTLFVLWFILAMILHRFAPAPP